MALMPVLLLCVLGLSAFEAPAPRGTPCPPAFGRRRSVCFPPLLFLLLSLTLLRPCKALCAECGEGPTATVTGNYVRPEGWRSDCLCSGDAPKIAVLNGTLQVKRGNFVEMRLKEGNGACPPYTWQVEGKDFHFGSATGPTTVVTEAPDAVLSLWAGPASCGPAFVTLTDGCGLGVSLSFRDPGHGKWVLVYETPCGVTTPRPGGATCTNCSTVVRGAYKYQDCWWGGTFTYEGPFCGKWQETQDLSDTCCHAVGYYPCFKVRGLREHKKWEWRCN